MRIRRQVLISCSLLTGLLSGTAAAAQSAPPTSPPPTAPPPLTVNVEVIGTTPLPVIGLSPDQLPAPIQVTSAKDVASSGALDLSDFLNRRLSGVFVNEMQNNPFQPDVNYRGYTASPLLGTPQGLSVYMDGVRLNQPFGDVVSWDLIPRIAIASTTLMPGSNPLFGLNTLGGALSVQTKDGQTNPGTDVQAIYGTANRRSIEFEHGGSIANRPELVSGGQSLRRETAGATTRRRPCARCFGKLGWQYAKTDFKLTVSGADNALTGNGLAGAAASRRQLRERVHRSRHDQQPVGVRESHRAAQRRAARSRRPATSTTATSTRTRSTATSTTTRSTSPSTSRVRPTRPPSPPRATPGFRRAARTRRTRRFRPGAASRRCSKTASLARSATACSIARQRVRATTARPARSRCAWRGPTRPTSSRPAPASTAAAWASPSPRSSATSIRTAASRPSTRSRTAADRRQRRRRAARRPRRSGGTDPDGQSSSRPTRSRSAVSGTSRCRAASTARRFTTRDNLDPGGGPGSLDGDDVFSRFNPAAGVTFNPSTPPERLCRLQRGQPCADVHRAGLRGSRSSRASCPTRLPAIRRSTRS